MSRFKLIAFIALTTLAFGVALLGDAVAGEKIKGRVVGYTVKWENVPVGDEEGHVIAVIEDKGIDSGPMGGILPNERLYRGVTLIDANLKTCMGSMVAHEEYTDRDGDKYYIQSKGKLVGKGGWEGEWAFTKGTAKYEGIEGKGTWSGVTLGPMQWYVDYEGEMGLPK